ncbi:MAG TPA: hypothetical protein VLA93_15495 [Pyrinomonadaceae bacterium]|nr:hypothetical protein [Pyrinomonadaceae bacterium]
MLVPLNFLAIAAVSSSSASDNLILASEIIAPAVFLTLVYYAGRVITPGCARLLSAGILLSSIGQLLVRHFATAETTGFELVVLGAVPVICFLATVGLTLQSILARRVMNELEVRTLLTMLGTISFASALPFGLLLYKTGPLGLTMMYLAPTVTMWGLPLLLTGVVLWRRVRERERVATRTTGGTLAILGVVIAVAGVVLSWPNPASIVPSALIAFFVFSAIAVALELPVGHLIAALCLALAYEVTFNVAAATVPWTNLRVFSLLDATLSASSGVALIGICFVFLVVAEWLARRERQIESIYYHVASGIVAALSLVLVTLFGVFLQTDLQHSWLVYLLYSMGAFWIAWRRQISVLSWIGSVLVLFSATQLFADVLSLSFPWQTAFLVHASLCAVAAVTLLKRDERAVIWKPFYFSSLVSSFAVVICLFQANPWQVTAMQAERVLWIAGIWLVLLWINRKRLLFTAFQIATTCGVILTVKAALQACDWYAYLPHAFLHPTGLLIQATVLLFVGLVWIALRITCRRTAELHQGKTQHWTTDAWALLDSKYSIDRLLSWSLLGAFLLLILYGVSSGVTQELAAYGSDYNGYNLAGFPRQEVLGVDSWIVFGLLLVTMLAHALERRQSKYVLGAAIVSTAAVPLLAGLFEPQIAVASAWRWLAALYLMAASILLWNRTKIARHLTSLRWPHLDAGSETLAARIRTVVISFSVATLVLLGLYPSLRAIYYLPVRGPASGIFSLLNIEFSYSATFVIVALIFVGYSLRDRSARFALASGVFLNAAVTIAYLLSVVAVGGLMDRVVLTRTVQLNAITCSLFALAWLKYRHKWEARLDTKQLEDSRRASHIQVLMPIVLNALLVVPAVVGLVIWPSAVGAGVRAVSSFLGWLAWSTTVLAFAFLKDRNELRPAHLFCMLGSLVCMLAFLLADANVEMMTGLHTLTVGMIATAWLLFVVSMISADTLKRFLARSDDSLDWSAQARHYTLIAAAVAVVSTIRPGLNDPSSDWWAIVSLLALSALFATIHSQTVKRIHLLISGILFNVAGAIWWISYASDWFLGGTAFLQGLIIILSLSGAFCLCLELRLRQNADEPSPKGFGVHSVAASLASVVMSMLVVIGLVYQSVYSRPLMYYPNLGWTALVALAALFLLCLYDQRSRYAVAGLYLVGLLATGLIIQQMLLRPIEQFWVACVLLSLQALIASGLSHHRSAVLEVCRRFRIPARIDDSITEIRWLNVLNVVLVAATTYLALATIFRAESLILRLTASAAVAAHAVTFALLAEGQKRQNWQSASIAMSLVGVVLFGWAMVSPFGATTVVNRGALLTAELCAAVALFGFWSNKIRDSRTDWIDAVRRCLPWTVAAAAAGMLFCLNIEIYDQLTLGFVRIQTATIVLVAITCVAAMSMLVTAAVLPARDPLQLTEHGRMIYVYAAEVILVALFIHLRLTMPWLFGSFERYWPFIIMVIAYVGVLVGESLRRQRLTVVARPLERTGAFLPLLPVLGFWIAESEVDYSALLLAVGGLYGLLSLLRRSFKFGVIAAVCANGALWYFLQRTEDYQFLQHPQLWLIPVAICVLLATHLNEDDFTEDQLASTRYLSLATIYLSSTADIIINGVANSPWLPLVLAAFSLAGVFGGIVLRIRGMLLLGSTFLLFSIITMIWYASANFGWTWLWYVAGIVTGATIIFMFAVFEKKRSDVLRLVDGLREWER